MSTDIFVYLKYNIKENTFKVDTNAKNPKDIVSQFLRSQMGAGRDERKPNKLEEYRITLDLDLSDDSFICSHNCGNKGLREGILMSYVSS